VDDVNHTYHIQYDDGDEETTVADVAELVIDVNERPPVVVVNERPPPSSSSSQKRRPLSQTSSGGGGDDSGDCVVATDSQPKRWSVLRDALTGADRSAGAASSSIHRHEGFLMLRYEETLH
jgi:hypothetical protein